MELAAKLAILILAGVGLSFLFTVGFTRAKSWIRKRLRRIDYVYFDLGSVIVDIDKEAVAKELAKYTLIEEEKILEIISCEFSEGHERLWHYIFENDRGQVYPHEFFHKVQDLLCLRMTFQEFVRAWQSMLKVDQRFIELIKILKKQGIRTGIISDLCLIHYERARVLLPQDLFDNQFYSFIVHILKRDEGGAIFETARRAANLPGRRILFIDDRGYNTAAAQSHGFKTYTYAGDFDKFVAFLSEFGVKV